MKLATFDRRDPSVFSAVTRHRHIDTAEIWPTMKEVPGPKPRLDAVKMMNSTGAATQTANEERLYRIGDVARMAEVKPFVLRYWETEFPMLEPVKSISGHRMYRQEDVDMVLKIKRLLYDEGFTIAGARRHLREQNGAVGSVSTGAESHGSTGVSTGHAHPENATELLSRKMLLDLRDSLRAFLTLLERR